jgi:hypothetical protein
MMQVNSVPEFKRGTLNVFTSPARHYSRLRYAEAKLFLGRWNETARLILNVPALSQMPVMKRSLREPSETHRGDTQAPFFDQ